MSEIDHRMTPTKHQQNCLQERKYILMNFAKFICFEGMLDKDCV